MNAKLMPVQHCIPPHTALFLQHHLAAQRRQNGCTASSCDNIFFAAHSRHLAKAATLLNILAVLQRHDRPL
jgi:hypothetical protein